MRKVFSQPWLFVCGSVLTQKVLKLHVRPSFWKHFKKRYDSAILFGSGSRTSGSADWVLSAAKPSSQLALGMQMFSSVEEYRVCSRVSSCPR